MNYFHLAYSKDGSNISNTNAKAFPLLLSLRWCCLIFRIDVARYKTSSPFSTYNFLLQIKKPGISYLIICKQMQWKLDLKDHQIQFKAAVKSRSEIRHYRNHPIKSSTCPFQASPAQGGSVPAHSPRFGSSASRTSAYQTIDITPMVQMLINYKLNTELNISLQHPHPSPV